VALGLSMFDKILVANRGEIACRIARSCRKLGVRTVAVYSEADARAQHVLQADEALPIGGPRPADSYLRGEAILEAARRSGAQAIHPGYGFLSENADFAEAVEQAGLVFIGPRAASMRKMGSKAGAKILMQAHGVPVVPGYTGEDQDPALLAREAARVGFPLMIKAAHGGGGKGMRIVRDAGEFAAALESCQRESKGAFGRDRVLLERYVATPRHIEFQVFGDAHGNVIHLGERECSIQRRHQKLIEEAPSPALTPELRERMGEASVKLARAVAYQGAGTIEYLLDLDGSFYFMEMNTRIQVEHPVTEMVTGVDLVKLQIRIAAGEKLTIPNGLQPRGHAIECRVNAEDPVTFVPSPGRLTTFHLPGGPGVRVDTHGYEDYFIPPNYDSLVAKLIVHAGSREEAVARMKRALDFFVVEGIKTSIPLHREILEDEEFRAGRLSTRFMERFAERRRLKAAAIP